jgi:predicted RNase H-like HicB family nuclease
VRFPRIPEALTEGETDEEARTNAIDCVITALEGYMKASSLPEPYAKKLRLYAQPPSGPSLNVAEFHRGRMPQATCERGSGWAWVRYPTSSACWS